MQLVSTRPSHWFYVDWWLMNHCSWSCSYCHDVIKSGNIELPYIIDCIRFVDQAVEYAKHFDKRPNINFTGGEVTEWANFVQLLEHADKNGCYTQFRSNANLASDLWKDLLRFTNKVIMEVHPEYTQVSQFLIALNWAVQHAEVQVNINMSRDRWDELLELETKITAKWPQVIVCRKMLFEDPVFNTSPQDYNAEQVIMLKGQTGDIRLIDQDNETVTDYQTIVLEGKNKFTGWQCMAGIEQVVVDAWGKVHRGHCRQGGYMGHIKDPEVFWYQLPKVCKLEVCRNAFDILASKSS